ncbi:MAG: D-glycero-beta-D-manno-heptose 1-phosphate adenylyltransferase [Candidatus Gastranaerophilales bacterium]|nr:D-glycero-beta-D-manno-heptose 1-phosphate adenylyltransferase [Candidatus Gastranaerophilales bacterium]
MGKIVNLSELIEIVAGLKEQNKTIVTTNGCFDILHAGHVRYLKAAKELGDVLILCLNSDSSVKRIKGESRPLNTEDDRAEVVAGLESVDYVIIFNEDTPTELLGKIKPHIHVKGGDYDENTLPEAAVIKANDGVVRFIPLVEGRSTTNIIKKISADAAKC